MRRAIVIATLVDRADVPSIAHAQLVVIDPANLIEAVSIAERTQRQYQELMAQYRTILRMSQGLGSLEGYRVPAIAPSRHDLAPWSVGPSMARRLQRRRSVWRRVLVDDDSAPGAA